MDLKFKQISVGTRCPDKAYIILTGLTGSGKTTTLNFLFDGEELTRTDSYASATSQILEYRILVPTADFGECELRVIDTPGFGDTRQKPLQRDAQFMATFDNYLKTHSDLKACYPTTVLMVVKYNDDRIDGETSHFIQMLKAIDNLLARGRLIDRGSEKINSCNLVFVLTHTMSEENETLQADPSAKIKLIEGLVRTFTSIPTPIQVIMAENKPDQYQLPLLNGYHKLPNGQYYPKNLFNKIQSITLKSNDPIGETIIREAFRNPQALQRKELVTETQLLPFTDKAVKDVYSILNDARFHIEATEMSKQLKDLWTGLDEKRTKPYFNTLQITQAKFHKMGIKSVNQIPKTQKDTLQLLSELPLNPPLVEILEKLGVCPPELPNKTLGVGHFYNMFGDVILPISPFAMHEQIYECTEIGFRAPHCVKAFEVAENVTLLQEYQTMLKYHQERMKTLNVDQEISADRFESEPKPGHNIIGKGAVHTITGIREHRQYAVNLVRKPQFSVPFKTTIRQLPTFSNSNEDSKSKWQRFFEAYGTHVVKSAYAGGYVKVTAVRNAEVTEGTSSSSIAKVIDIVTKLLGNVGSRLPPELKNLPQDWSFSVDLVGGDINIVRPKLNMLFTDNGIERYKEWIASLKTHPTLLLSEIQLSNIIVYVQQVNIEAAHEMDVAMKSLTGITGFAKKSSLSDEDPTAHIPRAQVKAPEKRHWYHKLRDVFGGGNKRKSGL